MPKLSGSLEKMSATLSEPVSYGLRIGDATVELNPLIGQSLKISYEGKIICLGCAKATKKSYNQGYCFMCFKRLARCDMCILKPEQCHYHLGTCREPEWGNTHCMIDHYVYLANTSGLKVGLTRHSQIPTRWIDQGATQAMPIIKTQSRRIAGLIEVAIGQHMKDKTDWRALLKSAPTPLTLADIKIEALDKVAENLSQIREKFGEDAFSVLEDPETNLSYPVAAYPEKVTSVGLDKLPTIEGTLTGIKGQYLYFGNKVFNVRKHSAYHVSLEY
ncbi:MAG: hypothetical protein CMF48_06825 [Legionellales bacterium]|nr:hypothetical protein [Legionellales bacterium]